MLLQHVPSKLFHTIDDLVGGVGLGAKHKDNVFEWYFGWTFEET